MLGWLSIARARFPLETIAVVRERRATGHEFEGDVTIEPVVARAIDHAHAAFANLVRNAVMPEQVARLYDHR